MTEPTAGDELLAGFLADPANAALDLSTAVERCTKALGLRQSVVYLADLQQRLLVPLTDRAPELDIDGSLAGWSYRTQALRVEEGGAWGLTAWLPLVDGAERLGVVAVAAPSLDPVLLARGRALASLLAMMITSKRAYKDSFIRRTRTEPMRLPAELLQAFLPPRTVGTPHVVSTAVLEPAYEIGGDGFDHALTGTTLHASILDAMGHDLASGLTTSVTLAACRNARRTGADLPELVESVDAALSRWLPEQFCTGILSQLDLAGGVLRWINCGHPAPLLIRDRVLVPHAMEREADPPMGYLSTFAAGPRQVHEIALEPGDRVLMYTDGATESRMRNGTEFGLERFVDYVVRAAAAGELAPETLRRLIHSLLESESTGLRDDATILMLEWKRPQA
ncbi:PP2C family protein-serine/threonine phosphatase [Streptomyces sp. ITFR-16]|uniref:PP2C family protein-serine/threonine phosphatase n=1 Tax=Streptomyces sp. ITFR-16 TaxID=3075198 RepID=UPI00288B0336|nr:PP2C family protein-serine/threonine phosphatase [Streptomyces sp. ITFR-16]WNI26346.1 PP2C family protein-serine/threonine phosphatase [Streptomyces sp. ITFR-16]